MIVETGHVVAVQTDSVWVETIRNSACGTCAAQKGCGHGMLSRLSRGRSNYIEVFSGALAASSCVVDDHVRISIPEEVILRGSVVLYMWPLFSMLVGAAVAVKLLAGNEDLAAIAGAACGLAFGMLLVRWHAWRHRSDKSLQPSLVGLVEPSADIISVS